MRYPCAREKSCDLAHMVRSMLRPYAEHELQWRKVRSGTRGRHKNQGKEKNRLKPKSACMEELREAQD
jgi:hypothetical protein